MTRSTRTTTLATFAVAAVALAGCTSGPEPTPTSASASPTTSSAAPPPSPSASASSPEPSVSASLDPPLEGFSLDEVSAAGFPDGGPLEQGTGLRVGHHTGYDRVVWQFLDDGPVAYEVGYVDVPTGDGSGDPVAVEGDAYLQVLVSGLGYPDPADCPPPVPENQRKATVFAEVGGLCGGFEGIGQTFLGLDTERPFRVLSLTNPTRLVVDVATD